METHISLEAYGKDVINSFLLAYMGDNQTSHGPHSTKTDFLPITYLFIHISHPSMVNMNIITYSNQQ